MIIAAKGALASVHRCWVIASSSDRAAHCAEQGQGGRWDVHTAASCLSNCTSAAEPRSSGPAAGHAGACPCTPAVKPCTPGCNPPAGVSLAHRCPEGWKTCLACWPSCRWGFVSEVVHPPACCLDWSCGLASPASCRSCYRTLSSAPAGRTLQQPLLVAQGGAAALRSRQPSRWACRCVPGFALVQAHARCFLSCCHKLVAFACSSPAASHTCPSHFFYPSLQPVPAFWPCSSHR